MKKMNAYFFGITLIISSILFVACTKSSTSDDDLIGNWMRVDDFEGLARSEAVSFSIGENGYISTGSSNSERFNDIWEYNTTLRYWTQKANLPGQARNSAVGFAIGDKGYVATGYDGATRLKDLWEFDPVNNTWSQKADFGGSGRYDALAFVVDGKAYVGCGYDGNYLKDLWEFTPGPNASDPGTWEQKASVGGSKRSAGMTFVVNNTGYVLGGSNNGEILQDLWAYDQGTNTWSEKNKVYDYSEDSYDDDYGTIPRQNGVTFVLGNYVYIATGENSSLNSTTWQYDPSSDLWLEKTWFEATARSGAVSFVLNNRGFVLTGRNGSLNMDNAYEFLPNAEQVDND